MREQEFVNCYSGVKSKLYYGDTFRLSPIIAEREHYDIVFTSPPWPGFDNASNNNGGVSKEDWQEICNSVATLCSQASGINGVRGLIEFPSELSDPDRENFTKRIREVGLLYKKNNLISITTTWGGLSKYKEWWVILDKAVVKNWEILEKKLKVAELKLLKPTKVGRGSKGFIVWRDAVLSGNGNTIKTPPRFEHTHTRVLLDLFTNRESTLVDPFAGTGTSLHLAMERNVNSIGVEIRDFYARGIESRMKSITKELVR